MASNKVDEVDPTLSIVMALFVFVHPALVWEIGKSDFGRYGGGRGFWLFDGLWMQAKQGIFDTHRYFII